MKEKAIERKKIKRQNEKYSKWKKYYFLSFMIGLVLAIYEISLFRRTVIQLWIPLIITLTIGTIAFVINRKHFNLTNNSKGWFFPLFQNIVSWGFISVYLFSATNYYLADNEVKNLEFDIKSKSSMIGSKGNRDARKPLVTIDYFGFKKELVFTYEDTKKVESASKVSLTVRKGFFGFDILDHFDTVDNSKK
jgi:hypothetical protein